MKEPPRHPTTPDQELLAAELPSVETELTDADRVARMGDELAMGFEALHDLIAVTDDPEECVALVAAAASVQWRGSVR